MMGKLGEEVSQKIKAAIKAKLMELGIHIDNELPDYVMVLVANKKTQQQMEDDLSLFLGESTTSFTTWLHNVLKKLEQVTISTKARKKDKSKRRGTVDSDSSVVNSINKIKTEDMDDIKDEPLDDKRDEQDDSDAQKSEFVPSTKDTDNDDVMSLTDYTEVTNDGVNEAKSLTLDFAKDAENADQPVSEESRPRERIKIIWDNEAEQLSERFSKSRIRKNDRERTRSQSRSRSGYNSRRKLQGDEGEDRERTRHKSKDRSSKAEMTSPGQKDGGEKKVLDARDILKRKGEDKKMAATKRRRGSKSPYRREARSKSKEPREKQISSVLKAVIRCPEKPPPSIASLVKVTSRPTRTSSIQPNCNLILKAVAEAEKSLATSNVHAKKLMDSYVDEKTNKDRKRYGYPAQGNISVTLLNDRVVATKLGVPMETYSMEDEDDSPDPLETEDVQETHVEEDTMSMALDTEDYIESFGKEDLSSMEPPPPPYQPTSQSSSPDKRNRFIITLDSTASDNEVENEMESAKQDCEESDDVSSTTIEPFEEKRPERRQFDRSRLGPKVQMSSTTGKKPVPETLAEVTASLTRCKYWPSCESGDSCPYAHPSSPCRAFPNCHFGEKCTYIHPSCKFAGNCLNTKCSYSHTPAAPVAKAPRAFPVTSSTQLCMYYPNCTKSFCPFVHIKKPCRFGATCMKLGCEFDHGNGNKNPYKWVATNQ